MDIVALALLVSGLSIGFYWHRRRINYYRNLHMAALSNEALTKHFDHILKYANDMVFLLDDRAKIIEVNNKACSVLGYSREEFLEMSAWDLRPQELKLELQELIKSFPSGDGMIYETKLVRKDGTQLPVEVSARSFFIDDKQYLHAIDRDISDRKLMGESLRKSEERYRTLFENNPNPMWVYDVDNLEFITVNQAAVNHYGYSREEFLSMTLLDIRPEDDIPKLLENISSRTEVLQNSGVWRHKKKDGSIIFNLC